MRSLFEIDLKNYDLSGKTFSRPSARAIIIKDNKIAMIHSLKYDYYKFPGGGIKKNESMIDALKREVKEETGLIVIDSTIKEYGYVHRIQKGDYEDVFIQDNYYFLCSCNETRENTDLDDYEAKSIFTLEYVDPQAAIAINRNNSSLEDHIMMEREAKVLELIIKELM